MKPLDPTQLNKQLKSSLAPVYLIFGDEPLQLGEALAAVRATARAKGYHERQYLEQSKDFNWQQLASESGAQSLFSQRRLLELRLTTDSIGREGADTLRHYCSKHNPDVLLLIGAPLLGWKDLKTKWMQALAQVGVIVQVRKLQGRALVPWLEQRLRARGFVPSAEVAPLLAERVEGNLLAADQEITKLSLLRDPGPLDVEGLLAAVTDSARFDIFDLSTAALAGDRARVVRVLAGLAAEGVATSLVLWVLAREIRLLAAVAFAQRHRQDLNGVFTAHQVWESRRPQVLAAVKRYSLQRLWQLLTDCATVDLAIKGRASGDPWSLLARIADQLARGVAPLKH